MQLDNVKAKRSLKSIQNLCPDLSMTQLAHICTWFEDDKEGLPGVEPPVIEHMWALMHEDQPFLLKEDKRYAIPTSSAQKLLPRTVLYSMVKNIWKFRS